MIYKLYTDGATSNNGYENSYGGWAWALVANDRLLKFDSDGIAPATNNICELTAMIQACEQITSIRFESVTVYSDSAYYAQPKRKLGIWYKKYSYIYNKNRWSNNMGDRRWKNRI